MGFAIMVFSGLIGILLTILGIVKQKENKKWLISLLFGAILIAFAVWLAYPK